MSYIYLKHLFYSLLIKWFQFDFRCDFNKYTMKYINDRGRMFDEQKNKEPMEVDEAASGSESSGRGTDEETDEE